MEQRWLTIEEDDYILVIPDSDIFPHADISSEDAERLKQKGGEMKLDLAFFNCPCKPKINWESEKPIIVHNSFEDKKLIDESMENLTN